MTRTWCIVWILSPLLVMAMLDSVPDPPGVNPSSAQCEFQQLDHSTYDALTLPSDTPALIPSRWVFVTTEILEPYRPTDRIVHTGLAADPSPPVRQSFQS